MVKLIELGGLIFFLFTKTITNEQPPPLTTKPNKSRPTLATSILYHAILSIITASSRAHASALKLVAMDLDVQLPSMHLIKTPIFYSIFCRAIFINLSPGIRMTVQYLEPIPGMAMMIVSSTTDQSSWS